MPIKYYSRLIRCLTATSIAALLVACGGDGGGEGASTGSLSVSVTDAPAADVEAVCIHFTGITLHHSDGDLITIPYDPTAYSDMTGYCDNAVNISSLQGELSEKLMDSVDVKAGFYNWIRLDVDESLSYVVDATGPNNVDSTEPNNLSCPSCDGEQSGLKLNRGIVVPAGGEANFMIDLDLPKSLNKDPAGDYKLRPTLRLVDMTETGKITGTVEGSLIPGLGTDAETGCSVYVYAGHDALPDDYYDGDNVLTSAKVVYDAGSYKYTVAYLQTDSSAEPTLYTVALTCDVEDSLKDQNNDPLVETETDVIFTDGYVYGVGQNADVVTDQTTYIDFFDFLP